jgi:16S rRNA (adenine1518-N6/adenine1519-N6)-dimethyltransferase
MNDNIAKKSLGQHWLNDVPSLYAMAAAAKIGPNDIVLEIGPGLGSLTKVLVDLAKQVVAVEVDHQLVLNLLERVPADNLKIVEADILKFNFNDLPEEYKIAANIPYYLTSNLIRVLSETTNQPKIVAVLVQQEVAERAAAKPGDMSLLSVTAQYYWQISLGEIVPARLFMPPPKVNSQILIMEKRTAPLFEDVDTQMFFRLAKAGFSQRRKTVLNSLSAGLQTDREKITDACQKSAIDPARRAQTLSLDEWYQLYRHLFT